MFVLNSGDKFKNNLRKRRKSLINLLNKFVKKKENLWKENKTKNDYKLLIDFISTNKEKIFDKKKHYLWKIILFLFRQNKL